MNSLLVLRRSTTAITRSSFRSESKRLMRTISSNSSSSSSSASPFAYKIDPVGNDNTSQSSSRLNKWAAHSLTAPSDAPNKSPQPQQTFTTIEISQPKRRSRADRYKKTESVTASSGETQTETETQKQAQQIHEVEPKTQKVEAQAPTTQKKKRVLRPRKALITLSPSAVEHLQALLDQPNPQMIRIGVRNRGCSGLTYHLEYVTEGGKFDELIEQDGVKVLIDSKALFSIVGSQMDWLDDKLSSRFIFKNPNSKGTCGCGESFMV